MRYALSKCRIQFQASLTAKTPEKGEKVFLIQKGVSLKVFSLQPWAVPLRSLREMYLVVKK